MHFGHKIMKTHFVNNPDLDYEIPDKPFTIPETEEECTFCECCGENIERGRKIDDEPIFEYYGLPYCDACRNFIRKDNDGKIQWHKEKPIAIDWVCYIIKIKKGEDGYYYKFTYDYKDGAFWYGCDDYSFRINVDDENFLGWIGFTY